MCGIAGLVDFRGSFDREKREAVCRKMNDGLVHRGPDGDGYYFDDCVSLGMRRLSIIDLHGGWQPLYNEDKSVVVLMNGEIYNYRELRQGLLDRGHQFRTDSDTEVVAHLYEEEGIDTPKKLKGMFALVIYDTKNKSVLFTRDRFGEKPFYYTEEGGAFSYASEPAALMENDSIPRKLNHQATAHYLNTYMIPDPISILDKVYSLQPGHTLLLDANGIKTQAYFTPEYNVDDSIKSMDDAVAYIKPKLEAAVLRQSVSDVPLGAFLSGGIDSSTVVALLQGQMSDKLKTFTVRFEESGYDESPIAREVASLIGTDHSEITVPNQDFSEEIFWTIIDHAGMPFADSSAIPTYFISKEIRKQVTVALSGDGGDELFGGYPAHQWWDKLDTLRNTPSWLVRGGLSMVSGLRKLGVFPANTMRQAHRFLRVAVDDRIHAGRNFHELFNSSEVDRQIAGGDYSHMSSPDEGSSFHQAMKYRLQYCLPLDMLIKVDRMSMASSLEVRAPFLDPDLFEASTHLDRKFLISEGGLGKYVVRELMKDILPDSVFNHPKTGFSIPLHRYFNSTFESLADTYVMKDERMLELFEPSFLKEYVERGLSQKSDTAYATVYKSSHQLWALLMLGGWLNRFDVDL